MPWEITDDEARASFEVVRVADLPPVDRADIQVRPTVDRACGCDYCEPDWRLIARASVVILEEGIDPLDPVAIDARARELELDASCRRWLLSLFSPVSGIIVLGDSETFTNGMHRTHALRMAGVDRCVIYTGKGEVS